MLSALTGLRQISISVEQDSWSERPDMLQQFNDVFAQILDMIRSRKEPALRITALTCGADWEMEPSIPASHMSLVDEGSNVIARLLRDGGVHTLSADCFQDEES